MSCVLTLHARESSSRLSNSPPAPPSNACVNSVAASPLHPYLVFAACSSTVLMYDLRKPNEADDLGHPTRFRADEEEHGLEGAEIEQIDIHHKGSRLAAVDDAGRVRVLSLKSRRCSRRASLRRCICECNRELTQGHAGRRLQVDDLSRTASRPWLVRGVAVEHLAPALRPCLRRLRERRPPPIALPRPSIPSPIPFNLPRRVCAGAWLHAAQEMWGLRS